MKDKAWRLQHIQKSELKARALSANRLALDLGVPSVAG
jgi:hypothetical protein